MQDKAIKDYLCQLNLKGMLNALSIEPYQQPMTSEQWQSLMLELLEAEAAYRQARSYTYRLTLARLPQIKTFENFNEQNLPIQTGKLEPLARCDFVTAHENVLLVGGSGTGKSHIALALAHQALQKNYRLKFYKFSALARDLIEAKVHHYESRLIQKLMRFHVLVIDELGYLPIDHNAGALLLELLSGFYEKGSLVITTHLDFDEWAEIFGNKKSTQALIDRITHHCHLLETGNLSWRLKEGKTEKT